MKRFKFMAGLLLIISLNACEKYTIKPPVVVEDISYSADVQPIFDNNCVGCHNGTGTADNGLSLDLSQGSSYNELMTREFIDTASAETSVLYLQMSSSSHSYYSSSTNRATVLTWIQQGAKDN